MLLSCCWLPVDWPVYLAKEDTQVAQVKQFYFICLQLQPLVDRCIRHVVLFWAFFGVGLCFDTHRQNSQTVLISPSAERENDLAGQWNFLAPALAVKCLGRGVVHSKNRKNPPKIPNFQGFFWGFEIRIPYFGVNNSSNSVYSNPFLFIKSSYTKK